MRISDWSSDVCSSDLHGMRNTRHIGAIVKRCLGIGQGAMKSQTILLCKTPLSFAHLQDFGYQAITNMRRAGRYIRGMVFEHDHRLGFMQLQGAPESTVQHVAAHACVVFVDETPVCANENASSGLARSEEHT